jgi:hypothetical protein
MGLNGKPIPTSISIKFIVVNAVLFSFEVLKRLKEM